MKFPEHLCQAEHFTDLDCGYRGPENWCDHSRRRCAQLGNLHRFSKALPPLRAPFKADWRLITAVIISVWTFLQVTAYGMAVLCYMTALIVYLPHFWGPSGLFCAMFSGRHNSRN